MLQESNKKLLKKRPPILIVAILAIFIAIAVISIIHISKAKEVEFISVKDNFKADENLVFRFKYRGNGDYKDLSIKVIVFNYKEEEVRQIYPQLEYGKNGEILVDLTQYFKEIKPGKYRLKFEIEDPSTSSGQVATFEQDFTWGVLAINTNKSIYPVRNIISNGVYSPDEKAYLQMAALTDSGHTICDANLKLEITSADGEQFSVTVQRSGECGPDNVTDVPDYFAYYQIPDKTGTYEMKLTNLDNGYEIIDSFEVKKEVPFDIERIGPTRIYPPATYQMRMVVRVNQDFQGEVIEYVPESFKILNAKPYTLNPGQIIWNVDWKAGENYEIKYQFDAPDISPYLYLLGPLRLTDVRSGRSVFEEARSWQIAADSPDIAVDAVSTGSAYQGTSTITVSHTTSGTNRLMVVGVSVNPDNSETVSSVTYGGVALTYLTSIELTDDARTEIWYKVAPATGTANVVVTFSITLTRGAVIGVITFTGVHQSTPFGTPASASGTASTVTVDVSSAVGELVLDVVGGEDLGSLTVGAGQTQRWNLNDQAQGAPIGSDTFGAGSTEPGATTVTMSWTASKTPEVWTIIAVPIKPAETAPPGAPVEVRIKGSTRIKGGTRLK